MKYSMWSTWIVALAMASTTVTAQPSTVPSKLLEPGEAEARDRVSKEQLPTVWTHPANEVRGVWLASRDMVKFVGAEGGAVLNTRMDEVKAAGINTVLVDTCFRGYVGYPGSAVLPLYPEFKGEDVLGKVIAAATARGLKTQLWMEYGFYAYFTADATKDSSRGRILDEHPDLLSVDAKGTQFIHRSFGDFYSFCPSNPKSHAILAKLYAEAIAKFPAADGVNLDRFRYAESDYCYCEYCKKAFKEETGTELVVFAEGSAEAHKWLEWKRERTAMAVETVVKAVRAVRPQAVMTSYVVGPAEMNNKAQGWDLWMKRGLLDGLAVSMYGADIRVPTEAAINLLGGSEKLISAVSSEQAAATFLTNIEISRSYKGLGQYIWHMGELGGDDIEGLRSGPYAKPAEATYGK